MTISTKTRRSAPYLQNPVEYLVNKLRSSNKRLLIALAGVPGSGKSTLAARLQQQVNAATDGECTALGMDGFHFYKAELRQMPNPEQAFARRGAPWTFNVAALYERLLALRHAYGRESVTWPSFEHGVGDPVEDAQIISPTGRLIIVEGLYLLHNADGWERVSRLFDERWYLDTPVELSLERLAQRHMQAWGMSRAQAEARIDGNDRLNAELVRSSVRSANWRVALD